MSQYAQTLTELQLQQQQVQSDNSLFCLSIYLPFNQQVKTSSELQVISTKFKSLVEIEVQKHFPLSEQKQLRLAIINIVSAASSSFDMTQEGVAVYATFCKGKQFRGGHQKNSDGNLIPFIQVVPLFTLPSPKSAAFAGKTFDLIPIIDNLNFDKPSLVVDIHEDEALLYEFAQLRLELFDNIQNSYIKFPEREEYLDNRSPGFQGIHSNRKDFNYDEDYLHQFLRDDLTKSLAKYTDKYKALIIVCPEQYQQQISHFNIGLNSHFSSVQTLNLTTDKTSKLLFKHLSQYVKNQIEETRILTNKKFNNPSEVFHTDMLTILEAADKGQVKTLYVVPPYNTPGFVNEDEDLVQPTDLSKTDNQNMLKTKQILLDIVQKVIEFGGRVIPISSESLDDKSKTIFAIFRF